MSATTRTYALASGESGPVVLVVDHALADDLARSAGLEQIGSFQGDVVEDERFVLYTTRGVAPARSSHATGWEPMTHDRGAARNGR